MHRFDVSINWWKTVRWKLDYQFLKISLNRQKIVRLRNLYRIQWKAQTIPKNPKNCSHHFHTHSKIQIPDIFVREIRPKILRITIIFHQFTENKKKSFYFIIFCLKHFRRKMRKTHKILYFYLKKKIIRVLKI